MKRFNEEKKTRASYPHFIETKSHTVCDTETETVSKKEMKNKKTFICL